MFGFLRQPWYRYIFLSILVHVLILSIAFLYGWFFGRVNPRTKEVYNVSVVTLGGSFGGISSSGGGVSAGGVQAGTGEPIVAHEVETKRESSSVRSSTTAIVKREERVITYSKTKSKVREGNKGSDESRVLGERLARLREEAYLRERLSSLGGGSGGTSGTGRGGSGTGGGGFGSEVYTYSSGGLSFGVSVGGVSGSVDPILSIYIGKIVKKIQSNWSYPESKGGKEAIVIVRIDRNGRIVDLFFEKKSGDSLFDSSVYRAVKFSSPFAPLPDVWKHDYMELGIKFRL